MMNGSGRRVEATFKVVLVRLVLLIQPKVTSAVAFR